MSSKLAFWNPVAKSVNTIIIFQFAFISITYFILSNCHFIVYIPHNKYFCAPATAVTGEHQGVPASNHQLTVCLSICLFVLQGHHVLWTLSVYYLLTFSHRFIWHPSVSLLHVRSEDLLIKSFFQIFLYESYLLLVC